MDISENFETERNRKEISTLKNTSEEQNVHRNKEEAARDVGNLNYSWRFRKWPLFNLLERQYFHGAKMIIMNHNFVTILMKDGTVYTTDATYKLQNKIEIVNEKTELKMEKLEILCNKNIRTFFTGNGRMFAVTEEGQVYAWGYNYDARLGYGSDLSEFVETPTHMSELSNENIVEIVCGPQHTLALASDRKMIYSWGEENSEEIRIWNRVGIDPTPGSTLTRYHFYRTIISMACAICFSVVVTDEGKVYIWGSEIYKRSRPLYFGTNCVHNHRPIPEEIVQLSKENIVKVTCGMYHFLALTGDGRVYTMGENKQGQLGIGHKVDSWYPALLYETDMGRIVDIAASEDEDVSAAVNDEGRVYVWGHYLGQDIVAPIATSFTDIQDVFVKVRMLYRPTTESAEPHKYVNEKSDVLDNLEVGFNDQRTSDLTIRVEGQSIYVHKIILQFRSEYFGCMFANNWRENEQSVIEHKVFPYVVYEAFLRYLYTGTIDLNLNNTLELFKLAVMYCERELQENCVRFIKEQVTIENAEFVRCFAIEFDVKELVLFCAMIKSSVIRNL